MPHMSPFTLEAAPALVTLSLLSAFTWPVLAKLDSALGPKNKRVDPDMQGEIRRLLDEVPGLLLMDSNLACSLMPILEVHAECARSEDEDLERVFQELDEDDLIPL